MTHEPGCQRVTNHAGASTKKPRFTLRNGLHGDAKRAGLTANAAIDLAQEHKCKQTASNGRPRHSNGAARITEDKNAPGSMIFKTATAAMKELFPIFASVKPVHPMPATARHTTPTGKRQG